MALDQLALERSDSASGPRWNIATEETEHARGTPMHPGDPEMRPKKYAADSGIRSLLEQANRGRQ
ncbi:MAG TPA: hypothetical protein DCQ04_06870 [Actinobacteria bacterium]|nr:hypothetical protein [Actinomycetota bacterium]